MKQPSVRSKQKNVNSRLEGTEWPGSTCSAISDHLRQVFFCYLVPPLRCQGSPFPAGRMQKCVPVQVDEPSHQDITSAGDTQDRPHQPLRHINFWSDHEAATRNPEAEVMHILTHTVSFVNVPSLT